MQYATLFALLATTTEAAPIIGGITTDMMCQDAIDMSTGTIMDEGWGQRKDCVVDAAVDDIYQCSLGPKPMGGEDSLGLMDGASWSELKTNCEAAFDTDAGDMKCVQANYVEVLGFGIGTCYAYFTSASGPPPAAEASEDMGALGEVTIGAGLGGMQLAAGSAAALAATYFM
jgi:hypothetical protein